MILTIDADTLGGDLRWEVSRGGDPFPHLYAPLKVEQVLEARPVPLDAGGVPVVGALRT